MSCGTVDHAQKIEPIVARLLDEDRLGGFHFNDGRYANDDFTLGSRDPHQVFRSFHEIHGFAADRGRVPKSASIIDRWQSEKPKIEATIQTVVMPQELYAPAAPVDHAALRRALAENNVVGAELIVKHAFLTDLLFPETSRRTCNSVTSNGGKTNSPLLISNYNCTVEHVRGALDPQRAIVYRDRLHAAEATRVVTYIQKRGTRYGNRTGYRRNYIPRQGAPPRPRLAVGPPLCGET